MDKIVNRPLQKKMSSLLTNCETEMPVKARLSMQMDFDTITYIIEN